MYRLRLNRCVQAYRLKPIEAGAFRASCDERYLTTVPCRGSFAQGGVTMRDCSKNRAGFDRVLMAVAATFLTVSATSALGPVRLRRAPAPPNSRSTQQSRAPNRPTFRRPTTGDFKLDTTASVPCPSRSKPRTDSRRAADRSPPNPQPRRPHRHRACEANDAATAAARRLRPRTAPARRASPAEPVKAASTVAPADQPVADRLREMLGSQIAALFRSQERARGRREVLLGARVRAAVDPGRQIDRQAARA